MCVGRSGLQDAYLMHCPNGNAKWVVGYMNLLAELEI